MGLYFGISCLRRNWNGIYLGSESGSGSDVLGLHGEVTERLSEPPESGVFSTLEEHAGLSRCKSWNDETVCRELHQRLDAFNLGSTFSQLEFESERPDAVGICHPYGLSPPARRALPAFVDAEPIQLRHRTERDTEHRDTRRDLRICAIETPFAASLALLDRSELQLPATVIVVAAAASGWEVTALRLVGRQHELSMSALQHVHIASSADAGRDGLVGQIVEAAKRDGILPNARTTVVSIEAETRPLADQISRQLKNSFSRELDEQYLAAGAARYTASCVEQDQVTGFAFRTLKCSHVAPRAIGICGRNSSDDFFWCPIAEAGDLLAGTHAIKINAETLPRRLVLAEHTSPLRELGMWAAKPDVDQLRWHSQITIDSKVGATPTSLEIGIEGSTGCLEYGWSDPFVHAAFAS